MLLQLGKSNESRKRLTNEVSYLTNKVDELSAALLKSKLRIGELEASNERLNMRFQETKSGDVIAELRQRVIDYTYKLIVVI
jgi:chromosome segregation ATPase